MWLVKLILGLSGLGLLIGATAMFGIWGFIFSFMFIAILLYAFGKGEDPTADI